MYYNMTSIYIYIVKVIVKSGDTSRCKYYYSNKMELPIFHDDNVMVLNSGKTI